MNLLEEISHRIWKMSVLDVTLQLTTITSLIICSQAQFLYHSKTGYEDSYVSLLSDEATGNYSWDYGTSGPLSQGPAAVSGCTPLHTSWLLRHGSRFGDDDERNISLRIIVRIAAAGISLRSLGLTGLTGSGFPFTPAEYDQLNAEGAREMHKLGGRVLNAYRNLLSTNAVSTEFFASRKNWTIDSAKELSLGMNASSSVVVNDTLVRFYDDCPKAQKEEDSVAATNETNQFVSGVEYQAALQRFNDRVCMSRSHSCKFQITEDEYTTLLNFCAQQQALNNTSPWCNFFSVTDLRVFEYAGDLETYYKDFHGANSIIKASCVVLLDIIAKMEASLQAHANGNSASAPTAVFRVGHRATLTPVLAALGVFKDSVAPTAANWLTAQSRKLRVTFMTPMSSNLELLVSDCNPTANISGIMQRAQVHVRLNGRAVGVAPCGQSSSCNFTQFASYVRSQYANCNLRDFCSVSTESTTTTSTASFNLNLGSTLFMVLFHSLFQLSFSVRKV